MKIYDTDSHVREFASYVTACRFEEARGLFRVALEKTAFFAAGGGQEGDTGELKTLDSIFAVKDVTEEDGVIWHWTERAMEPGEFVSGSIDYEARFDRMQQHTAEHIVSGLANRLYHVMNVGFHLGEDVTTFDFDLPLSREQVKRIEQMANEVIYADEPVRVLYPTEDELKKLPYRSKKELSGAVRIVVIGSGDDPVDICACCAPHVARTGEIGIVKIIRQESYKGGVRLTMVAGRRCYDLLSQRFDEMTRLADMLSTSSEKVEKSFDALRRESEELKTKLTKCSNELVEASLPSLKALSKTQPSLCLIREMDDKTRRKLIGALAPSFSGQVAVLLPKGEAAEDETLVYSFVIGSAGKDLRPLMALLKERFDAKGGGSGSMIQGSLSAKEKEIKAFLEIN